LTDVKSKVKDEQVFTATERYSPIPTPHPAIFQIHQTVQIMRIEQSCAGVIFYLSADIKNYSSAGFNPEDVAENSKWEGGIFRILMEKTLHSHF